MPNRLFFDRQDYQLLHMINETIEHGASADMEHQVFDANLHPHGILELTTTHEFRIAHAVVNLLGNLRTGKVEDRLVALRTLRDFPLQHGARADPDHEGNRPRPRRRARSAQARAGFPPRGLGQSAPCAPFSQASSPP